MRLPRLKELLGRTKLGGLMQRLFPRLAATSAPNLQAPTVGDQVQWTSRGVEQFPQPRKVVRVEQLGGQRYVFIEGSQTGIPQDQVRVVTPKRSSPKLPDAKSVVAASRQQSTETRPPRAVPLDAKSAVTASRPRWKSAPQFEPLMRAAPAGTDLKKSLPNQRRTSGDTGASSTESYVHIEASAEPSSAQRRPSPEAARETPPQRPRPQLPDTKTAVTGVQRSQPEPVEPPARSWKDKLQSFGDVAGVLDPTGIVDGLNAVFSWKRAQDEPERRDEHLRNAGISGISMIPLLGDLAKLTKLRKPERAASATGRQASGPRVGETLPSATRTGTGPQSSSAAGKAQRAGNSLGSGFSAFLGTGNTEGSPGSSSTGMAEALKRGSNFGDVLGGRKRLQDVEREAEGERKRTEVLAKFSEVVKITTGRVGALGLVAVGVVKALQSLNAARLAQQQELSYVSGAIASASAQRDFARFLRDVAEARGVAGSHGRLTEAQIRLERALQPGQTLISNLFNHLSADVTQWAAAIVEVLNEIANRGKETARTAASVGGAAVGGEIGARVFGPTGRAVGAVAGGWLGGKWVDRLPSPTADTTPPWNAFIDGSRAAAKPRSPRRT